MNKFVTEKEELLPRRSTKYSAGYDFKSPVDFVVPAHSESNVIDCEVSIQLDSDKVLMLYTRSGNGIKHGITLKNNTGIIDADYFPNTIKTVLVNNSDKDFIVHKGDRIMQGLIMQYFVTDDEEIVDKERTSGFGSTGK